MRSTLINSNILSRKKKMQTELRSILNTEWDSLVKGSVKGAGALFRLLTEIHDFLWLVFFASFPCLGECTGSCSACCVLKPSAIWFGRMHICAKQIRKHSCPEGLVSPCVRDKSESCADSDSFYFILGAWRKSHRLHAHRDYSQL